MTATSTSGRPGGVSPRTPAPFDVPVQRMSGTWFEGASHVWPLTALCVGMPVWFFLGGAAVAWSVPAVVLGLDLVRRRSVRMPAGAGWGLALLGWILLSGLQIRGVQALGLFAYRFSIFASMVVLFIWLADVPERTVPTRTIVRLLGALWIVLAVFGYLAILFPEVAVPGPLQRLLPGALRSDPYVVDLTNIRFAEAQGWLGYLVPRPSAPMVYANGWGSTFGLLTPFFVLGYVIGAPRRRRVLGWVLLAVGVVPAVISMNRGLWLSVALILAFVAGRNVLGGNPTMALRVVVAGAAVVAMVVLTPLGGFVQDKLAGAEDGDATRSSVYEEAFDYATRSPLLGYGAPVRNERVPVAVGTHGLLWFLMVSHGMPAAVLFVAWLADIVRRAIALRSVTGVWTAAAAVVVAFQLPIYGLLPQLALLGVIAAIVHREHAASRRPRRAVTMPHRAPPRTARLSPHAPPRLP